MVFARLLPVFALTAVGAVLGAASNAQALTLADLVNNGGLSNGSSVTFGDYVFENFSFTSTGIAADEIDIVDLGNGIGFEGNFSTGEGSLFGATIGYTVTATDPIKAVALSYTTGEDVPWEVEGLPHSIAAATMTLSPSGSAPLNEGLSVINGSNDWDDLYFEGGFESIDVKNSITALATRESSASIRFVANYFETSDPRVTQPPVIPEPASLVLLPLALAGLGLRKKFAR